MTKKLLTIFVVFIFLFLLSLVFSGKIYAYYCGLYGCESGETCLNCPTDCGACPPPPPPPSPGTSPPPDGGSWVPCGEHQCPNLVDWTEYKCYPSCESPQYCQNTGEGCPGDVPPTAQCIYDSDCFPNNPYCPSGQCAEMHCVNGSCVSQCVVGDCNEPTPPPDGIPWGNITCNPEERNVCPPDVGTATTTVSWQTINMSTAQVWRRKDNGDQVLWQTGTTGTQGFNSVQSNHQYVFYLYAYDNHGTLLDSCTVWGLCPTCTVTLSSSSLTIPPGESRPLEASVNVQNGIVKFVRFFFPTATDIATINPENVYSSPYITTITASPSKTGSATLRANVRLDPGDILGCTADATVDVRTVSWFQTQEGDVHSQGNVYSYIPNQATEGYFSLKGTGDTPGVVSYKNDYDFKSGTGKGEDKVSSTGWLAKTEFSGKYYDYFNQLLGSPTVESFTGALPTEDGVYYSATEKTLSGSWSLPANRKIIILVKGKVSIPSNIDVPADSFLAIIAEGDIEIANSVSQIEGVFISDLEFNSGTTVGTALTGEGMFIAKSFGLARDLGALNETTPSEKFIYRPDFWLNAPSELLVPSYTWQEIAP